MIDASHATLMAEYGAWMNQKLLDAAAKLSDEERTRDRGAFFQSIHGTLSHLLWGDSVWMSRFEQLPRPKGRFTMDPPLSFEQLCSERQRMDARILSFAQRVSQDWLAAPLEWKSGSTGQVMGNPGWVLLTHMFNHGTHHRGQVTTLLTQAGLDVGATDLLVSPSLLRLAKS